MTIDAGQTLSHYRLIEKIGEGGMGVVWKAEDTVLGRTVAIKVLPADVSRDAKRREMFLQEAKLASSVSAAHVAQVHEFGQEGDLDFIVMEYVEGNPLSKLLHGRPLAPHKVAGFGHQIAHALSRAHRKNLLHRDLKPANVIVTPDGEIKVLDFGLATLFQRSDTVAPSQVTTQAGDHEPQPVALAGTLPYMSPEQARMEALDARSDIFSLGTMLYEMTTGQLPFTGPTSTEVLQAVQRARPQPVHDLLPQVPLELDRIIQKAMAPRRGDRYQAVEDLAVDLKRLGKELESGSSPSYEKLQGITDQRFRRAPGWVVPTLIGLVVVAVVLAWWWYGPTEKEALEAGSHLRSLAVLPFANSTGDPEIEYLSDGLTEGLINRLAGLPGLRVVSRNSAFHYKGQVAPNLQQVAQELSVQGVVTGRVMQLDPQLIVSAELVDARTDSQLWGERLTRSADAIADIEVRIAAAIGDRLQLRSVGAARRSAPRWSTESPEAYRLYLRGRYHWHKRTNDDMPRALDFFNRAIELDPSFALAWSGVADCYAAGGGGSFLGLSEPEAWPRSKAAAIRALELDDRLAEAHTTLADVLCHWDGDREGADREFRRALELNPNYATGHQWYAECLSCLGRHEEALASARKALQLDPHSIAAMNALGITSLSARRYDDALESYRAVVEIEPDFYWGWHGLARTQLAIGAFDDAIQSAQRYLALRENESLAQELGDAYAQDGLDGFWRFWLESPFENSPFWRAAAFTHLGKYDRAFEVLDRTSDPCLRFSIPPELDQLRSDPRFDEWLERAESRND